jgi:hypothetical protein
MSGWYPKYTTDGHYLVSGAGELFVNGQSLNVTGWQPTPFDGSWIVYNGGPGTGIVALNLDTGESEHAYPLELIELAGGGGLWAGRDASRNAVIVSDGRVIENAGQPSISALGVLTYRTGDEQIEPSICRSAIAWGDGRGRLLAERFNVRGATDVTVGPAEHRPILLDTPEGAFNFCMAGTSLHLRPLFGSDGYEPPAVLTGNDRNINAHAVYADPWVLMAWQDTSGNLLTWSVRLTDERKPLGAVAPPPVPDPEPPPMSVPDYSAEFKSFVEPRLRHLVGDEQGTRAVCFEAVNAWVAEKRKSDPRVGLLIANPPATNVRNRKPDIVAYNLGNGTCQLVDVIGDSEGHDGKPRAGWSLVPEHEAGIRSMAEFASPYPVGDVPDPPPPPPDVPPTDGDVIARLTRIEAILTRHFK